jgi:hypothetical protein
MTYSFVKPLISFDAVTVSFSFYQTYDIFYLFSYIGEWTIHHEIARSYKKQGSNLLLIRTSQQSNP